MRSRVGEVIRSERQRLGLSQQQLANKVHVDRSMISHWERGAMSIPYDVLCRIVRALGSHRLRTQVCFECKANSLTPPFLDQVDMHPFVVTEVLIEELEEAAQALRTLRLANKRSADQLTDQDKASMEYAGEQVMDLLPAIQMLMAAWQEWYGVDVDRLAIAGYEKLFQRGYAKRQHYDAWKYVTA